MTLLTSALALVAVVATLVAIYTMKKARPAFEKLRDQTVTNADMAAAVGENVRMLALECMGNIRWLTVYQQSSDAGDGYAVSVRRANDATVHYWRVQEAPVQLIAEWMLNINSLQAEWTGGPGVVERGIELLIEDPLTGGVVLRMDSHQLHHQLQLVADTAEPWQFLYQAPRVVNIRARAVSWVPRGGQLVPETPLTEPEPTPEPAPVAQYSPPAEAPYEAMARVTLDEIRNAPPVMAEGFRAAQRQLDEQFDRATHREPVRYEQSDPLVGRPCDHCSIWIEADTQYVVIEIPGVEPMHVHRPCFVKMVPDLVERRDQALALSALDVLGGEIEIADQEITTVVGELSGSDDAH